MSNARLDPAALVPVSPAVAEIVDALLAAHPWLSTLAGVHVAILGVTSHFLEHLHGAMDAPVELDEPGTRRALLFLMNTQRPLCADPTTTAAVLFESAKAEIKQRGGVRRGRAAMRDFERSIAAIVHVARTERRRRATRNSFAVCDLNPREN